MKEITRACATRNVPNRYYGHVYLLNLTAAIACLISSLRITFVACTLNKFIVTGLFATIFLLDICLRTLRFFIITAIIIIIFSEIDEIMNKPTFCV
jgi:hypothetical protein